MQQDLSLRMLLKEAGMESDLISTELHIFGKEDRVREILFSKCQISAQQNGIFQSKSFIEPIITAGIVDALSPFAAGRI